MTTIKTKDFILRPMRISDAEGYLECQQDKEAKKSFFSVPKNLAEAKKEVKKIIAEYKKRKPHDEHFAIEVGRKFVGYVNVDNLNEKYFEHRAKIGYCIHQKYRGRSIATKAVKLVTKYAFKKYKLKRMVGYCRTFNKASARVLEKSGYKLEGILKKNKFKDGKYLDDMVWAMVK